MPGNNLNKETQIKNGKGTQQKGDWCELIAAAYFRKNNYHVFSRMSGPIDLVLIHQLTGETRYIDVKYKNTRKTMKTKGLRINRSVTTPLKKFIKIEIVYVGDDGQLEKAYTKGAKKWHAEFEVDRDSTGQYNGKVIKK